MKAFPILLAAAITPWPGPVAAQSQPPAMPRIRIQTASPPADTARGAWVVGHLERISTDSLWLRAARPEGPVVSIDRAAIQRLEMSDGKRRHPGTGALWGAGAGLGLGLLAVAALDDCAVRTRGWSFDFCGDNQGFVLLGSVAAGAAWGAAAGLLITSERWVAIPAPGLLTAAGGRIGVAFRLPLPR